MTVTLNIRHKAAPREHLLFSEHMTAAPYDGPLRETFLGQAHIAGTGPEQKPSASEKAYLVERLKEAAVTLRNVEYRESRA